MTPKGKHFSLKKVSFRVPNISSLLVWRIVVVLAVFSCLGASAALWFSGGGETERALTDGRRLVVTLKTGEIKGNLIESKKEEPPEPEKSPDKDKEPEKDPASEEHKPDEEKAPPVDDKKPVTKEPEPVEPPDTKIPDSSVETSPPAMSLPGDPHGPMPDGGDAPQPLTYDQLPQVSNPANQTSIPAVLPPIAAAPPLLNTPLPKITPAQKKTATLNKLLVEDSEEGTIPVAAADGTKAWRYYAKPYVKDSRLPMIAIVVTGLGHNKQVSQHAMSLPENITLGFSPYAADVKYWEKSVRLSGHEMMLELPLEPSNYPATDPGPYGLMLENGITENERRLRKIMSRLPTSIGFITPYNEKYSHSAEDFNLLLKSLDNRGLMIVMSTEPHSESVKDVLDETSTPNVTSDVFIDEELDPAIIKSRLYTLEQTAKKKGYAIGIAHAYPLTIVQLQEWVKGLKEKGVVLVPITAIAKMDFHK